MNRIADVGSRPHFVINLSSAAARKERRSNRRCGLGAKLNRKRSATQAVSNVNLIVFAPLELQFFRSRTVSIRIRKVVISAEHALRRTSQIKHLSSYNDPFASPDVGLRNSIAGIRICQFCACCPVCIHREKLVTDLRLLANSFAIVDRVDHDQCIQRRKTIVIVCIHKRRSVNWSLTCE